MELFKLLGTIAIDNSDANNAIEETTGKAEKSESKLSTTFKKIGTAVAAAFATEKIIAFGQEIVNVAADVSAEESAFAQIMGDYADTATEKVGAIADATGMVASRMTPYMTSLTAKFKGLGYDIDDATTLASDGLALAADASAFWDKSLTESMSALNSFINGSYEGGEAIGLFANDTQMAAYAVEQGIVADTAAWSALDEATKQATRLEYAEAMYEMSGATGQAAKESDQYANVQANLAEKWRQFKAQIGTPVLQNIVLPAMEKLSGVVDTLTFKYEQFTGWISDNKETFVEVGNVVQTGIATVKNAAQGAFDTISSALESVGVNWETVWTTAKDLFNDVVTIVSGLITALGTAIGWLVTEAQTDGTLINAVWTSIQSTVENAFAIIQGALDVFIAVFSGDWSGAWESIKNTARTILSNTVSVIQDKFNSAYQKGVDFGVKLGNTLRDKLNAAKTTVSNIFGNIKNAISEKLEAASNTVKTMIDKIRGFFNFSWSLPKLKLPHISVSGSFSLTPPSVPKFSIEWYKKAMDNAMLLNEPTIFGMNGSGQFLGGGEAGQEVVSGADTLMGMIQNAVNTQMGDLADQMAEVFEYQIDRLIALLLEYFPQFANAQVRLSTGELVGAMAAPMDKKLAQMARQRLRGN